jgi:hypothetical protein
MSSPLAVHPSDALALADKYDEADQAREEHRNENVRLYRP